MRDCVREKEFVCYFAIEDSWSLIIRFKIKVFETAQSVA